MGERTVELSDNIEAEFKPDVVIFANDEPRFAQFAAHIQKGGFNCQVHTSPPDEMLQSQRPGTIFYISFNLKSNDGTALSRIIEQRHGHVAIVFAEQPGTETAAKLSSARLSQTLQYPYTEKNFLMAVQTIVNKRKAQHAKDVRKNQVLAKRKEMSAAPGATDADGSRHFKKEGGKAANGGTIIQRGRRYGVGRDHLIKGLPQRPPMTATEGEKHAYRMALQEGIKSASFFAIEDAPSLELVSTQSAKEETSAGVVVELSAAGIIESIVESNAPLIHEAQTAALVEKVPSDSFFKIFSESLRRSRDDVSSQISKVYSAGDALIGYAKKLTMPPKKSALAEVEPPELIAQEVTAPEVINEPTPYISPMNEVTRLPGGLVMPTWVLIVACTIAIVMYASVLYTSLHQAKQRAPQSTHRPLRK